MITAKQAREKLDVMQKILQDHAIFEWKDHIENELIKSIEGACQIGFNMTTFDTTNYGDDTCKLIITNLKENGYRVTAKDKTITISW